MLRIRFGAGRQFILRNPFFPKPQTVSSSADFKKIAITEVFFEEGILKLTVKAGEIITWLETDFDLGHGHAMAIYHTFEKKSA